MTDPYSWGAERGAGVYDTDSLQIANLADEIVEPLIVDRTATKDIDVFGCQRLILSECRVDRVGVKAVRRDLLVLKVLAKNGGNQTLSDAALSLQDDMDLIASVFCLFCCCHGCAPNRLAAFGLRTDRT